ncbi:MAG: hypothetical protein MJZ26_10775 [Fibrobacter sp.]|nr:hypothetical protein [Fibrobacter sp.]
MSNSAFEQNVIALVWDCDKTLISSYMQEPLFRYFNIDGAKFWAEVNALKARYGAQGISVNSDTCYLNHILTYVKAGIFKGLSNKLLREFGKELKFYPGLPDFFGEIKKLIEEDPKYMAFDIRVEHYVVSTGFAETIKGSAIAPYVDGVFGCEFIEDVLQPGFLDGNITLGSIDHKGLQNDAVSNVTLGSIDHKGLQNDAVSNVPLGSIDHKGLQNDAVSNVTLGSIDHKGLQNDAVSNVTLGSIDHKGFQNDAVSNVTLEGGTTDRVQEISQIACALDNTSKTRYLFEINKGSNKYPETIDVNSSIAREVRRVPFQNMVYIADGPSDVPAFSILNYNGGSTFAVYPKGDVKGFKQVDALRRDGRVQMFGEADYSPATQSWMWLTEKARAIADKIVEVKQAAIKNSAGAPPTHLN